MKDTVDKLISKIRLKWTNSYIERTEKFIEECKYLEAKKFLTIFLKKNPGHEKARRLALQLNKELGQEDSNDINILKKLAQGFLKEYCPNENIIFEVVWDILKDATNFILRPSSGLENVLTLAGKEEMELKDLSTPIVAAALLGSFKHHGNSLQKVDIHSFTETAVRIAKENGASDNLVETLRLHITSTLKK